MTNLTSLAPTSRLFLVWLVVVVGFGLLLAIADAQYSGLNDPDPAYERPGFLDAGELPIEAPPLSGDIPRPGERAVVFFTRSDMEDELIEALQDSSLVDEATLAIVVAGAERADPALGIEVIPDHESQYAREIGMPRPRDGGAPVGYIVVDSEGRIRYRTLHPDVSEMLDEVETILEATP